MLRPYIIFGMLALRIALGLALTYTLLVLLAWRFQDRLAFPAPRAPLPDPKRVAVANGEKVEVTMEDGTRLLGRLWKPVAPQPPPTSPTSPSLLGLYGTR